MGSSACWWSGSGKRRSRHNLFVQCRAWAPQVQELWKIVGKGCGWKYPRAPAVRLLFQDERATPAVLRETRVGSMVTLVPPEEEWEELEEIVLRPEGEVSQEEGGEEGGPPPP